MTQLPELASLTIRGPLWTAEADTLALEEPRRSLALRAIFLDLDPRRVAGQENVLAPGTLLALVRLRRLTLHLRAADAADMAWARQGAAPAVPRGHAALEAAVRAGELALLLLAADDEAWPAQAGRPVPPLTCVAGELGLAGLTPQAGAEGALYAGLGLSAPAAGDPAPAARPGPARLLSAVSAHSSGLTVYGRAALPWQPAGQTIAGPFQLARRLPDAPGAPPAFRLTPELERMTAAERAAFVAAWAAFGAQINPGPADPGAAPQWATLELSDPERPPRLSWPIPSWQAGRGPLSLGRGELILLLSDRSPHRPEAQPATLARVLPTAIDVERQGDTLVARVAEGLAPAGAGRLRYRYEAPAAGPASESQLVEGVALAFSPTETAERIRRDQALPAPRWERDGAVEPVDPAVLWAFVPLDDGWAQLPVPNLSERVYLDSGVAQPDAAPPPSAFAQGAVSLTNQPSAGPGDPAEQPWSLTIAGAARVEGSWTVRAGRLERVELALLAPELVAQGLLWLSAGRPTPGDALPDLDDWVAGLASVPLRSPRELPASGGPPIALDRFPSPVLIQVERLSVHADPAAPAGARLGAWAYSYEASDRRVPAPGAGPPVPLLARLADAAVLPAGFLTGTPALLWRRHPSLPLVQALPLTQAQQPPSHPSASRQLAPFALPADGARPAPGRWRFGVFAAEGQGPEAVQGARSWPRWSAEGGLEPAAEWGGLADLPMAALSLPGLALLPAPRPLAAELGDGLVLGAQYRHDLPYADEPNALAQPPKIPRSPDQISPLPADPPPQPARVLLRADYAAHWRKLSELAALAAVDAADALARRDGQNLVEGLVEPHGWPASPQLDLAAYPGSLRLDDGQPDPVELSGDAALRGISADFALDGALARVAPGTPGALQVTAGSLAAAFRVDGDGTRHARDQRGLERTASKTAGGLVRTPLRLEHNPGEHSAFELTSSRVAWSLRLPGDDAWQLWFRDLPLGPDGFSREATRSAEAEDANDPEALGRRFNALQGYEWRLAAAEADDPARLSICGLDFFPVALEALALDGDAVSAVTIAGRLQLPLREPGGDPDAAPRELDDLGNIVALSFTAGAAGLTLSGAALRSALGDWPLALSRGELSGAPRLHWSSISLAGDELLLGGARLRFFLFEVDWTAPIAAGALRFAPGWAAFSPTIELPPVAAPFGVGAVALSLDPAGAAHSLAVELALALGRALAGLAEQRSSLSLKVRYPVLGPGAVAASDVLLFDDIRIDAETGGLRLNDAPGALQLAWSGGAAGASGLQLLPGVPLAGGGPGCAALTFAAAARPDSLPELTLRTAFVEALLDARWGRFLHDPAPDGGFSGADLFASSAGELSLGYAAHWLAEGERWDEEFLLNGLIELRSVISWPRALRYDKAGGFVELPAARPGGAAAPLPHLRHSARVLLNQHSLPAARLTLVPGGELLFTLADQTPWQFIAVVEHQLLAVELGDDPAAATARGERRWTVAQELRVMLPAALAAFLARYGDPALRAVDPDGIGAPGRAGEGYLSPPLRAALAAAATAMASGPPALLVEAGAPHWVRRSPAPDARPTTLQFLPGGSQHGVLSAPDDFAPSDPADPEWLLVATPFLGRLQAAALDGDAAPLRRDPLLALHAAARSSAAPDTLTLALTGWAVGAPARIFLSALETTVGRSFARLDPLSLEESWFRIQHPLREPAPERLRSVAAALPDTPARSSRAVALADAFDTFRPAHPPAEERAGPPPPEVDDPRPLWREGSLLAPQRVATAISAPPPGDPGLVALYTFEQEGDGRVVRDRAARAPALDLTIADRSRVEYLPGGGLRFTGNTIARSAGAAAKLHAAITATNAISVELWIQTDGPRGDPAHIVSMARNPAQSNVAIVQGLPSNAGPDIYEARLRSTTSQPIPREPALTSPPGSARPTLTHIVFTRDASGAARLYLDGAQVDSDTIGGNLSSWDDKAPFGVGAEPTQQPDRFWRGAIFMLAIYDRALSAEAVAARAAQPYAWLSAGALLAGRGAPESGRERHAAATLLPARLRVSRESGQPPLPNPLPLSLAVSPYLGLEFRPAPAAERRRERVLVAELLTMDPGAGRLLPAAGRAWELPPDADEAARAALRAEAVAWAREAHRQTTPESPLAVLRLRALRQSVEPTEREAALSVAYEFLLVDGLGLPAPLARRAAGLRAPVDELRFREGQFGGSVIPAEPQAIELAPPQVVGVQPLYLAEQPSAASPAWPWGLSALRYSLAYTAGGRGVSGRQPRGDAEVAAPTLWWQAPQQTAQLRSALAGAGPAAGLPARFRAPAIKSLLPVLPDPPLPRRSVASLTAPSEGHPLAWQPLLPGALRMLLVGNRAGAPLALRAQLIRQRDGEEEDGRPRALVSGSVPVQHRVPRPVPLPPNDPARPDVALRTWASRFEPTRDAHVSRVPADEAFYADCGDTPARRLRLSLLSPPGGVAPADWDGTLIVEYLIGGDAPDTAALSGWRPRLSLLVGDAELRYPPVADEAPPLLVLPNAQPTEPDGAGGERVSAALSAALAALGLPLTPAATIAAAGEGEWQIADGPAAYALRQPTPADPIELRDAAGRLYALRLTADDLPRLRDRLRALSAGGELRVQAAVEPAGTFRQRLDFGLRVAAPGLPPLPLTPLVVLFEDPEYNRRLASQAAQLVGLVRERTPAGELETRVLTLACDRRAYNPESDLNLSYVWEGDDSGGLAASLRLRMIDPASGAPIDLKLPPTEDEPAAAERPLNPRVVLQLSLRAVAAASAATLRPGNALELALEVRRGNTTLANFVLRVDITADPVIPAPEAAYGLLRDGAAGGRRVVECARFAWGPPPARVELVCADDLFSGVVRRRAVFRWRDTVRVGVDVTHRVQKIHPSGATHMIALE